MTDLRSRQTDAGRHTVAPIHKPADCTHPDCLALDCVAHRAEVRALDVVNEHLGIEAAITFRGDELKCAVIDNEDGGRRKAYFTAGDCVELATAFTTLASVLERTRR